MSFLTLVKQLYTIRKDATASAIEIQKLQKERLHDLLRHALTCSPFYKRYYGEHGITLENLSDISLEDIPPIDKKMLMENFDELICDQTLNKKTLQTFIADPKNKGKKYRGYQIIHTSGSTGTVGLFVYDVRGWATVKALAITHVSKNPLNPFCRTKIAFIGAVDGNYAGISLAGDAPKLLFKILPLSVNSPLPEIRKKINDFQPDRLSGYASSIHMLAEEQLAGNIRIAPKRIVCSGDALTLPMRETIKKAFGVNPINFYAASESLCMAVEDDNHTEGLRLFNDQVIFECVDENNRSVPTGGPGNVMITNLYNYTQPLIRYRMNDHTVFDKERYENRLPLYIKSIGGRQEEFLWFTKTDGTKEYIHPMEFLGLYVAGVDTMQIIQQTPMTILARISVSGDRPTAQKNIETRIKDILKQKNLDHEVSLVIEIVQNIPLDPKTGKFRRVVPYKKHQ